MKAWKFVSLIEEEKEFKVQGLNIWNFYWHCTDRKLQVHHPSGGDVYFFNEYKITAPDKTITFVAGEFSDGKIGLYLPDETPAMS